MRIAAAVFTIAFSTWTSQACAQCAMPMPSKSSGALHTTESGQGAFAAIHEIEGILEADPHTDWSKVNIDALRAHLVDMDNVTLHAVVAYNPLPNGEQILVSGQGEVRDSIQRMVMMHVSMAGTTKDWVMTAEKTADGVKLTVIARSDLGLAKIKGLGFFGMLAEGVHHTTHHMMLARGEMR